jgi:alpha-tubulin suppressor-like RCC1 family protein
VIRALVAAALALGCYGPSLPPTPSDAKPIDGPPGSDGVLGDADTTDGAAGCFRSLSAGGYHSCVTRTDGATFCWGLNGDQQIEATGPGEVLCPGGLCFPAPHRVATLPAAIAVEGGDADTCVIGTDRTLSCRGRVVGGPASAIGGLGALVRASGGLAFACAASGDGTVGCVGDNDYGQLGRDPLAVAESPTLISQSLTGIAFLSAGSFHACAAEVSGPPRCWGANDQAQLGGTTTETCTGAPCSWIPVEVSIGGELRSLDAGANHTCVVKSDGTVWCWGANVLGQLGNDSTMSSPTPVQVSGLRGAAMAVSAGGVHTCALLDDRTVDCWGFNNDGEFGDGTTGSSLTAVASGFTDVTQVSAGSNHTCVLVRGGRILCSGTNGGGQVGSGAADAVVSTPREVMVPCGP